MSALRRTPFDIPFLLLLLLARVSIWPAYDTTGAWHKFWLLAAAVAVFYVVVWWQRSHGNSAVSAEQVAWLLLLFAAGLSVYFLITTDWSLSPLAQVGERLGLPYVAAESVHPNVVAGVLATVLPFAGAVIYARRRTPLLQSIAVALMIILVIGLVVSFSRAAWLALVVVVLLWLCWRFFGRIMPTHNRRRFAFTITVSILVLALCAVFLTTPGSAIGMLRTILADQGRFDLYSDSFMLLLDYPILGAGLGSFMMNHATYAYLTHVGFSTHAHNLVLDLSIEMGIAGVLVMGWIIIRQFAIAIRFTRHQTVPPWLGAATLSTAIIILHGMLDDPLYSSRAVMLLFVPTALTVPYARPVAHSLTKRLVPVMVAALVIMLIVMWRPIVSTGLSNWGALVQSRQELTRYHWPQWALQDQLRRELDLATPVYYYQQALHFSSTNVSANRRLGQIELSNGDFDQALAHLETAYKSAPWDNSIRQMLGEVYIVTGDTRRGTVLWTDVDNTHGQLDARAYWYRWLKDAERQQLIRFALGQIGTAIVPDPNSPIPPVSN
ncbi:MAG: O-antigen ligase family protein [Anaerolineae bacterium]|nr:O-antigen ligase family protein [Anaerolineae bacterium]